MKLIIDISEDRYKDIQRIADVQLERNNFQTAEQIIANGTPLPSVEPEKCSDCISRQAARNALLNKGQHSKRYKLGETWELNLMEIEETLWALPSIEPEKCGDCINREALNKKLNYLCECLCEYSKKQREFMCEACKLGAVIDAVEEMPSVEPERKTGKWEYVQYDGNPKIGNWHCSECRLIVNFGFEGAPYYRYCPGCGAEMEVDG